MIPASAMVEISPDVAFSNPLWQIKGRNDYVAASGTWNGLQRVLLPSSKTRVRSITQLQPSEVDVRWEVEWVPENLRWLEALGRAWPGVEVKFVDLLDKVGQRSTFSWAGVIKLFQRAITDGVLLIPVALIRGSSTLTFRDTRGDSGGPGQAAAYKMVRHVETLELVDILRAGGLKNRRIARDLRLFLEARRPPSQDEFEWYETVEERLEWESVPGMGQFDIEGLDPNDQSKYVADISLWLTYVSAVTVIIGVTIAWVYLSHLKNVQDMQMGTYYFDDY
eukprot:jgi/Mesvir1/23488/Mv22334-RA.1